MREGYGFDFTLELHHTYERQTMTKWEKKNPIRTIPGKLSPFTLSLTIIIHKIHLATNDATSFNMSMVLLNCYLNLLLDFSWDSELLKQVKNKSIEMKDKNHIFYDLCYLPLCVTCKSSVLVCASVYTVGITWSLKRKTTLAHHNYIFVHHLYIPKLCSKWTQKNNFLFGVLKMVSIYWEASNTLYRDWAACHLLAQSKWSVNSPALWVSEESGPAS